MNGLLSLLIMYIYLSNLYILIYYNLLWFINITLCTSTIRDHPPRTGTDKQLGSWSVSNTWWLVKLIPLQGLANVPFGGFLTAMYEYLLEIQWYPPKVGYVNNWNKNANLCMISPSIPQFFSLPLGAMLLSVWDSQSPSWRLATLRVVTAPPRWRKRWTKAASQRGLGFFLQETHGNPLVYYKHANKSASFSVKRLTRITVWACCANNGIRW